MCIWNLKSGNIWNLNIDNSEHRIFEIWNLIIWKVTCHRLLCDSSHRVYLKFEIWNLVIFKTSCIWNLKFGIWSSETSCIQTILGIYFTFLRIATRMATFVRSLQQTVNRTVSGHSKQWTLNLRILEIETTLQVNILSSLKASRGDELWFQVAEIGKADRWVTCVSTDGNRNRLRSFAIRGFSESKRRSAIGRETMRHGTMHRGLRLSSLFCTYARTLFTDRYDFIVIFPRVSLKLNLVRGRRAKYAESYLFYRKRLFERFRGNAKREIFALHGDSKKISIFETCKVHYDSSCQ